MNQRAAALIVRGLAAAGLLMLVPGTALAAGGGLSDLIFPAINLSLLLGVLFYFAHKPVQAFFQDRRDHIRGELEAAAELRKEAELRHSRWQRQLIDLEAETSRIRAAASERAESESERILDDARAAAQRIRDDARAAIEQEVRRARHELREEAADLSLKLASDILRSQVTDSDNDRLVDEFIRKIEEPASNGSGSGSGTGR